MTTGPASSSSCSRRWQVYVISFFLMMSLSRYRSSSPTAGGALSPGVRAHWPRLCASASSDGPPAREGSAREQRMSAFFIASPKKTSLACSHAPADGEAHRAAHAPRGELQARHARGGLNERVACATTWGSWTRSSRQEKLKGPAPTGSSRVDGVLTLRDRPRIETKGQARSSSSRCATADSSDRRRDARDPQGHRRGDRHDDRHR